MNVGKVYYVTTRYNENKFKTLLEQQLKKTAEIFPSDELIELSLAAYLECKDINPNQKELHQMEQFIKPLEFVDNRNYRGNCVVGSPIDAVNAFNELMLMYNLSQQKQGSPR